MAYDTRICHYGKSAAPVYTVERTSKIKRFGVDDGKQLL